MCDIFIFSYIIIIIIIIRCRNFDKNWNLRIHVHWSRVQKKSNIRFVMPFSSSLVAHLLFTEFSFNQFLLNIFNKNILKY